MGEECQYQPDGAKVVDRHDPFVVVESVDRVYHRAANRAPGIVDQVVHMAELAENALHGVVDGGVIGEVAGERVRLTAVLTNLRDQLIERLPVASDREHGAPAFGDGDGRRASDAAGCTCDDDVPAHQRPGGVVAPVPLGVQVSAPVLVQPARVTAEGGP